MPKESFLFVPYHAGHQSLADIKIANSDARSHAAAVSRQRRDHKRLKSQLGLQTLSSVTATSADAVTPSDAGAVLFDVHHSGDRTSSPDNEAIKKGKSGIRVERRQHMRAMQFSWRAGNVTADFKVTNGIRGDPFGYLPFSDYGRSVIDYYTQVISPVNQPIYAIFNVTNVYTSYWMELLQHEDYRPAGLAMVGAIMQKICQPNSQPSKDVRINQATATSRLENKFSAALKSGRNVGDDIAIITVLALASLARFLGDVKAYENHRNNVKKMVRSRGGLRELGHNGLAKCVLLQWDSFWVFETEGTSLFSESRPRHIPVYPAFPLSPDLRDVFVRLPVGFQCLILKGKIAVGTIETLGRMVDASTAGVKALDSSNMSHSLLRKHSDFVEACPCLGASTSANVSIEKDICLALLLYCANTFTKARSMTALYAASRVELTRLLIQADEAALMPQERECLFWICAVCVDSWRQSGPDSPLMSKGLALLPVLKRLKNGSPSDNTLQKFFFQQELLDSCERYLTTAD